MVTRMANGSVGGHVPGARAGMDYLRVTLRTLSRGPWLYVRLVAMFGAWLAISGWYRLIGRRSPATV
ncbi:MAG TPA: hypothetical protein QGH28_04675 [Chloroflexota bacterium]|nr:hypothetical protein [Chloroflexota bacterium]